MSEDSCEQGETLLSPASVSKLSLAFSDLFKDFPQELIPHVLVRLPTKSLDKFTSVSKPWSSMIKDPTFIRTYLTHKRSFNTQNSTPLLLLHSLSLFGDEETNQEVYSLHYDNPAFSEYCKIEYPNALKKTGDDTCFRVVGTCNGLVCLVDDLEFIVYSLVLWNPCVRKYVILPEPFVKHSTHGLYQASTGLGFDALTNDYKVVRLATIINGNFCDSPTIAEVYSLAKGYWSRLRYDLPQFQTNGCCLSQPFVNAVIHWLVVRLTDGAYCYFVLTFDVGNESFGEIMLPNKFLMDQSLDMRLSASGDQKSIALFASCISDTNSFLDIWLMKEYCVEKSWTKLMILTPQGPERSLPMALCFRKSGEVMLMFVDNFDVLSVDLVSKQFRSLGSSEGQLWSVDSFEESLVLLDRKDAVSY